MTGKNYIKAILSALVLFIFLIALPASAQASTLKGYTISSSNTRVYSNTGLTKGYGWIYGSDEVIIHNVTDSYSKVTYSVSRGTKTGYVKTSSLFTKTSGTNYTAQKAITAYRRPGGYTYGKVYKGDRILVLGTSGSYTQLRYPVSGGYKFAFVKTTDLNSSISTTTTSSSGSYVRISDGWYMIQTGCSSNRILDINNWNLVDGGNLEIYAKNNTTNQRFYVSYVSDGYYRIRVGVSGKYLDVAGGSTRPGTNVQQYTWNGSSAQLWRIKSAGNGYYYLQSKLGTYLDNSTVDEPESSTTLI